MIKLLRKLLTRPLIGDANFLSLSATWAIVAAFIYVIYIRPDQVRHYDAFNFDSSSVDSIILSPFAKNTYYDSGHRSSMFEEPLEFTDVATAEAFSDAMRAPERISSRNKSRNDQLSDYPTGGRMAIVVGGKETCYRIFMSHSSCITEYRNCLYQTPGLYRVVQNLIFDE